MSDQTEFDVSTLREALRSLAQYEWNWSSWAVFADALGLREKERVLTRRSYYFLERLELDLFAEGEGRSVRVPLAVSADVEELSDIDYENLIDEFFEKFDGCVADAQAVLGPPAFNDGAAATGFPEDQDAVMLALWELPTARLMIQLQHEGRDVPIRIEIVVAPPIGR